MNIASRIRRSFFTEKKKKKLSNGNSSVNGSNRNEDDLLGVTDELIDHVRSFTIDTFKNFSLDGNYKIRLSICQGSSILCCFMNLTIVNSEADEEEEEASVNPVEDEDNGVSSSANLKKDLSDWQEKHAVLVLSKSKVFLKF